MMKKSSKLLILALIVALVLAGFPVVRALGPQGVGLKIAPASALKMAPAEALKMAPAVALKMAPAEPVSGPRLRQ